MPAPIKAKKLPAPVKPVIVDPTTVFNLSTRTFYVKSGAVGPGANTISAVDAVMLRERFGDVIIDANAANATTEASLNAEIAALKAQLAALNAK